MIRDSYTEHSKLPIAATVVRMHYFRPFEQLLFESHLFGDVTQELVSGMLFGIETVTQLTEIL